MLGQGEHRFGGRPRPRGARSLDDSRGGHETWRGVLFCVFFGVFFWLFCLLFSFFVCFWRCFLFFFEAKQVWVFFFICFGSFVSGDGLGVLFVCVVVGFW